MIDIPGPTKRGVTFVFIGENPASKLGRTMLHPSVAKYADNGHAYSPSELGELNTVAPIAYLSHMSNAMRGVDTHFRLAKKTYLFLKRACISKSRSS